MAVRQIVEYPAAVLLSPGEPVVNFDGELEALVQDMFDTMYKAEGVGLAAQQIGVPLRLFVMDCNGIKLVAANPDRIVWGSDWPHPNSDAGRGKPLSEISSPFPIDDGLLLNQLPKWAPDAAVRKKILVDNPARLYGFEAVAG